MKDERESQRRRWTEEEDEIIRKNYVKLGNEIASMLDRTMGAITERASVLGVARRKVGGKREREPKPKPFKPKELSGDITLEELERYNRELIKSLSFRNVDTGRDKPKPKYYY